MSDSIQWGVLGCATIARVCVIPAIQASHNGTVAAIASRSPSKAKELSHLHDIPKVYAEYAALLDDPDIDAVYIPLPNHLHCRWTIKALDAGKHVLCEKPLARNAAEAGKMAVAAARTGKQLMEGFMYRFHSRSRRIKQMIDTNAIGTPLLVRSAFCYRMKQSDWDSPKNARLNPDMGGGALLDVGCYSVSVARWMLGTEPVRVQAQAVFHPNDVDIHLVGSLRLVLFPHCNRRIRSSAVRGPLKRHTTHLSPGIGRRYLCCAKRSRSRAARSQLPVKINIVKWLNTLPMLF